MSIRIDANERGGWDMMHFVEGQAAVYKTFSDPEALLRAILEPAKQDRKLALEEAAQGRAESLSIR